MKSLASDGVVEGDAPGVEHEAAGLFGGFTGLAVDRVADEGRALVVEMDPDLVGAAGVEVAEDQGGEAGGIGG